MTDEASLSEVFRQSLRFLRRYVWFILLLAFAFAGLMAFATQNIERLYKSSVQLMIEPVGPSPIEAETTSFASTETGYVDGQILLIEAEDTLLRVVERGNLTTIPFFQPRLPNAAERTISRIEALIIGAREVAPNLPEVGPSRESLFAKNILSDSVSINREGDTNVITIGVRANSATLARNIAALVAETYVAIRLLQRQEDARAISDWIDARAEELRQQVSTAEEAVTDYRIRNSLMNGEEGGSLNDQQLTEVNAELIRSRADLAQKKAALARAREVTDSGGDILSLPEVQASGIVSELRSQLLLIQLRERDLSVSPNQSSPRLTQIRQQTEAMLQQLNDEVVRIVATLGNEVEVLESRTALLTEALSDAGGQSKIETQINLELRQLERVAEAYRQRYQRYLDNGGLAVELKSFTTNGIKFVTTATVPIGPFYPNIAVFVVLGFMMGTSAAIVIALARDALDSTFRSARQVEDLLGVKVRAQIPQLKSGAIIPDIVEKDPLAPFSETISVLRYMMFAAGSEDDRAPVFLITSNAAGEGKTSIAASLAVSAKIAGHNVLLIDADMRRAGLTSMYGFDGDAGFAEILEGDPWEAPDLIGRGCLDILPAGILNGMPLTALESQHLPRFIDLARQSYDLIVIDGPPVAYIADCTILSKYSDQLLFVVRWGTTQREQALRGFERLPRIKVTGAVMNYCPPKEENGLGSTYKMYSRANRKRSNVVNLWGRRTPHRHPLPGTGDRKA